MTKEEFLQLTEKIANGTANENEIVYYNHWCNGYQKSQVWDNEAMGNSDDVKQLLFERIKTKTGQKRTIRLWLTKYAAAAILFVSVGVGLFIYVNYRNQQYLAQHQTDIAPGENRAILILSNGKKIVLNNAKIGEIISQDGVKITKANNGQLVYEFTNLTSDEHEIDTRYNTIETQRGGQYQVILADGTKIWLNAASTITFPVKFSNTERRVKITGEGYFEVAKNKLKPFIVDGERQEITVLGTHFNIYDYPEEKIRTTLLEGSVKVTVKASKITATLVPTQQFILGNRDHSIEKVDTEEVVAWKDGYFRFYDEHLENIMQKVSRWYNVEIVYNDEAVKNELFAAVTTRFVNVSKLLNKLEQTGNASFTIEGRKIIVSKK